MGRNSKMFSIVYNKKMLKIIIFLLGIFYNNKLFAFPDEKENNYYDYNDYNDYNDYHNYGGFFTKDVIPHEYFSFAESNKFDSMLAFDKNNFLSILKINVNENTLKNEIEKKEKNIEKLKKKKYKNKTDETYHDLKICLFKKKDLLKIIAQFWTKIDSGVNIKEIKDIKDIKEFENIEEEEKKDVDFFIKEINDLIEKLKKIFLKNNKNEDKIEIINNKDNYVYKILIKIYFFFYFLNENQNEQTKKNVIFTEFFKNDLSFYKNTKDNISNIGAEASDRLRFIKSLEYFHICVCEKLLKLKQHFIKVFAQKEDLFNIKISNDTLRIFISILLLRITNPFKEILESEKIENRNKLAKKNKNNKSIKNKEENSNDENLKNKENSKNEDSKSKNEDSKDKSEDSKSKNEDSKDKNEDSKSKNEDSTKDKNEDSKSKNEDSRGKNEDSKDKNEDSKSKNEDSRDKNENSKSKEEEEEEEEEDKNESLKLNFEEENKEDNRNINDVNMDGENISEKNKDDNSSQNNRSLLDIFNFLEKDEHFIDDDYLNFEPSEEKNCEENKHSEKKKDNNYDSCNDENNVIKFVESIVISNGVRKFYKNPIFVEKDKKDENNGFYKQELEIIKEEKEEKNDLCNLLKNINQDEFM